MSRKLNWMERYYISRNTNDYYTNFNIVAKYNHRITPTLLSHALHSVLQENIWLTYNVFKSDSRADAETNGHNWELRSVDQIDFEEVVSFEKKSQFGEATFAELNRYKCPMNVDNLPLWRIIVYELPNDDQYICAYFDHCLYDGLSGLEFQKDLVKALSEVKEDTPLEFIYDKNRDSHPLPKSLIPATTDQINIYQPTYYQILSHYFNKYLPLVSKTWNYLISLILKDPWKPNLNVNPVFTPGREYPNTEISTGLINFNPTEVQKIYQYCKSQNITLTPYFHAICLKCLEDTIFPAIDPSHKFSSTSITAINGRRYFPQGTPFRYGCIIAPDFLSLPPVLDQTRSFMGRIQTILNSQIKSRLSFREMAMLQYFNFWSFFERYKSPQGRCTLTVSNLGRVPDSGKKFKIVDAYFGLSTGIMYNFVLNMITTEEGGLNVNLNYLPAYEELYAGEKKVMDVFMARFREKLLNFPEEQN
ncbi:uncharacterized protein CANTADRAFT_3866 [Suhomyces tanzawaensis NRRL Y-17324]|uniref:Alcohol acetyltransferase n=1 Tax=Suhomyces tanzawaensis NRRL Y-17324 TaxID=984487 RepID=A0A1E4SQM2_9ASCO|nr:uncharacterized protein CANTADRAFT_3866 [Suhomyces tanzawaensis NRRL Y-17324]ODV81795.1 hypothetical protein CANTADRAFT_3866 [Suhomyces tanzawaensis NRRL Y-17324]